MKTLLALSLVLLFGSTSTALAQDVRYNFDKNADFASFKTYRWVTIKEASKTNELLDRQIKAALDVELSKKGLTLVDGEGSADLAIAYQVAMDTEKEFHSFDTGWGYGPGWYGRGWYGAGGGMTTGQTSTIYVGQLALDIYHVTPRSLVWRGTVSKTLDRNANPEKQQKNLAKSVAKLLRNFPPKTS
jgi:hypothetical protein